MRVCKSTDEIVLSLMGGGGGGGWGEGSQTQTIDKKREIWLSETQAIMRKRQTPLTYMQTLTSWFTGT